MNPFILQVYKKPVLLSGENNKFKSSKFKQKTLMQKQGVLSEFFKFLMVKQCALVQCNTIIEAKRYSSLHNRESKNSETLYNSSP